MAVVVHSLDRPALARMEQEAPALANRLHRVMIALIAERLVDNTTLVQAMAL